MDNRQLHNNIIKWSFQQCTCTWVDHFKWNSGAHHFAQLDCSLVHSFTINFQTIIFCKFAFVCPWTMLERSIYWITVTKSLWQPLFENSNHANRILCLIDLIYIFVTLESVNLDPKIWTFDGIHFWYNNHFSFLKFH